MFLNPCYAKKKKRKHECSSDECIMLCYFCVSFIELWKEVDLYLSHAVK